MIPFHDWKKCEREGFRTRDAHFMQEIGKHPSVDKLLIVNRPISLIEMALKRIKRKHRKVQKVDEKTYTIDIVLPDLWQPVLKRRNWIPEAYGREETVSAVRYGLQRLGISEYVLFTNEPIHVPLIAQLAPQLFVFDMTDNLLKHASYRDMSQIENYYEYCVTHASVITTNSPENTEWLKQKRPDVLYIPNGVDATRFNPEKAYNIPEDMCRLSKPVVGFAGKMQEMIDVDLMVKTVEATPKVNYVFIGQQLDRHHISRLWHYPNVHYLGDKHYDILVNYLAAFDVCIIPYHVKRQHGVDPIKFYEYMAMGKPIVTTDIGGVSAFRNYPQVKMASTRRDFLENIKFFVEKIRKGEAIPQTSLPPECFWSTKTDYLLEIIKNKLESEKT